jgi:hercynylcysteine S-oxide lyase
MESNPDKFLRYDFRQLSPINRARVAKLIGAETDEVVLVPNATHGVNTVLKNINWKAGDYMIQSKSFIFLSIVFELTRIGEANVTYGAVSKTVQYILDVTPGLNMSSFDIMAPTTHGEIIEKFRSLVASIKSSGDFSKPDSPKIVAVIDAIVSNPGISLPWERMVELCHQEGVLSVVDAAHSIGHQFGIDLSKTKPDFWISASMICNRLQFANL